MLYIEFRNKILSAIMERDVMKLIEYHEILRLYLNDPKPIKGYSEGYCTALSLMCLDALDEIYKEKLENDSRR